VSQFDRFTLEPHMRGVPYDVEAMSSDDMRKFNLSPTGGRMPLPLLTIDPSILDDSIETMMRVARRHEVLLAPHFKTSMSPALARRFARAGIWAVSVADLRQALVFLRAGFRRVVIANEIGGGKAARRLAELCRSYRDAELYLFVDSIDGLDALTDVWRSGSDLPTLRILLEVGCGRSGVRSDNEFEALLGAFTDGAPGITLGGIAAYEGTALRADFAETQAILGDLLARVSHALTALRRRVGPNAPLLLSMGSSSLFDLVITQASDLLKHDGNTHLMLRSGSCYFGDHGETQARLDRLVARGLLGPELSARIGQSFRPAMRLWAETLSCPSPGLAVCGLGMRDAAHDQGNPVPLRSWRGGQPHLTLEGAAKTSKLNDQHSFVTFPEGLDVRVGDIIEFGIRHPCTTIDKHDVIYAVGDRGVVLDAFKTFFG
jgi:D-serine dehydratase